ncbi:MAG: hypothetical protein KDJ65_12020 [Anaerolineae bacterium]|nr:hypothetical protein [Anaerolineae bacterium]
MESTTLAYFVSPHGFGHAARASAVMTAFQRCCDRFRFEIFTKMPGWFYKDSGVKNFTCHDLVTDIGMVQKNALKEDLPQTIAALDDFFPFDPALIGRLAGQLVEANCRLVVCDIAPLGIAVAKAASIPSVLIENFTWDWIYEAYITQNPKIERHVTYLQGLFDRADIHIQTEPICRRASVDLTVGPISRVMREPIDQMRQKLGVPEAAKLVVLSMGGTFWDYSFLETLDLQEEVYFAVAGNQGLESRTRLIALPLDIYHPDLLNAADALIGKVGYSTLAEVYQAGIPFGYIGRSTFRESPFLVDYVEANIPCLHFEEAQFEDGRWLTHLPDLLALPRSNSQPPNGADEVARFISGLI